MAKIILWIVVIFVILFVLLLLNVAKARRGAGASTRAREDKKVAGTMVRCTECGTFVPKTDALPSPTGFRCSDPACLRRHGNAR